MTRVIEWIISLLIVIALFVVIGLFLPAKRTVSHSIETNRPMATVNDILSSFTRFRDWNALVNHDPRVQLTTSGPESGEGATLAFQSSQFSIGSGEWKVVEFVPGEKIVYALDTPGRGKNKTMTFRFERTGQRKQNVEITQRYSVDYGWDLLGRYSGTLYVNSEIGADIKRGLGKLSNLLATIPRFDYSLHEPGFQVVELPAENVLLVTTAAKRANDDIALAMTNQRKWIDQVMEKNELEAAGPMRIVTNEFGADTYGFDVVLPIRRKGTGPADEATDAAEGAEGTEGEAVAEAPAAPAVDPNAPLETFDVKVEGPVVYAQLPARRAAKTTYTGPSPGLARIRDLVRAWSLVRGYEPTDRPYEDYLGEIKDMLAEDAEFNVYWPIRTPGVADPAPRVIAPLPEDEGSEAAPAEADEAGAEAEAAAA
ncbi:MAG TPA: SRPBCC family protein [Arenimonas sp.]|uniref:SRPBCC family protein n=1 Tax=Arenimonas sp. TaxID=1872635 RepID=UPI002D7E3F58|nr:SRPBCC family protein [Arenimonas sp.]HEU0151822.1 SRPBCC family protein [Arenimonas sp.]